MPTGERLHNGSTAQAQTPAAGLKERVLRYLRDSGVDIPDGRIVLLTLPRVGGYLFNPVSFYFCYDSQGRPAAAIAEVTNTFGEVKPYLPGPGRAFRAGRRGGVRIASAKVLLCLPLFGRGCGV